MTDLQTVAIVAGVAVMTSLVTIASAASLLALWKVGNSDGDTSAPCSLTRQRSAATKTPEPGSSGTQQQQTGGLFSPINKQKRPDPYDPKPRNAYLSWDDYFMALAFLSAERSKDPNKQVGACIVNDENIILSIGYNGFPRGCSDSSLPWSKKATSGSILDTKYPYVVHAEANALLNKNQAHVTGARIYVTLFPCNECAKLLIQAGIKEVIFHEAKLEPTGQRPATMERAAEADAAADRLEEAAAAAVATKQASTGGSSSTNASSSCGNCPSCSASEQQPSTSKGGQGQQQEGKQPLAGPAKRKPLSAQQQKFSVGASNDVDASYAASQRLLMLAGVKLRQHRLQRSIQLGPS